MMCNQIVFFAIILGQNVNFVLTDQAEAFQLLLVFCSGGHQVDAGCFDAGMSQHIRKLCDVVAGPVEGAGKQVPQIMRKYLRGFHTGLLA